MRKPKYRSGTQFIAEIPKKAKRVVSMINYNNRIYVTTEGGVYFIDNSDNNKLKLLVTAKELGKLKLGQTLSTTIK